LRPGRFKLIATAIDPSGILGKSKGARFRIVPR